MSNCLGVTIHTWSLKSSSIFCLNLLIMVAWRLIIISLSPWHTFLFFLSLSPFFLSINETLTQLVLLGLIARLSSNHIWVFSNMWAIFIILIQQWPLEFRNHFPSPSWCPRRLRSTNIWGTSGHLHICWHRRWRPLCGRFSTTGVELGEEFVGFWGLGRSSTWSLVSRLFGNT